MSHAYRGSMYYLTPQVFDIISVCDLSVWHSVVGLCPKIGIPCQKAPFTSLFYKASALRFLPITILMLPRVLAWKNNITCFLKFFNRISFAYSIICRSFFRNYVSFTKQVIKINSGMRNGHHRRVQHENLTQGTFLYFLIRHPEGPISMQ